METGVIATCLRKGLSSILIVLLLIGSSAQGQGTRVGFYSKTCPRAESIVRSTVESHFRSNPEIAPALLRMHFHDCIVQGCDASILIDGPDTEKTAIQNTGLQGYNVIDDAKTKLEATCPQTVSCADILALAARDAVVLVILASNLYLLNYKKNAVHRLKFGSDSRHQLVTDPLVIMVAKIPAYFQQPWVSVLVVDHLPVELTNGRTWKVPTGRKDGRISLQSEANATLPGFKDSIDSQKRLFASKGLNTQDLVVLVGGHTIGTTSCQLFSYRLYNTTTSVSDPSINATFLPQLQALCPQNGDETKRVALDTGSQTKFDSSFFTNLISRRGILESDKKLWTDASTRLFVQRFSGARGNFNAEFAKSMIKMSNIGVKTGIQGEIRKVCSVIN